MWEINNLPYLLGKCSFLGGDPSCLNLLQQIQG